MQVGVFQVLEKVSDNAVIIRDELYGEHLIKEPVLIALLHSPALNRLAGICQHGITGLFGLTPRVTRFEHSVGAFLLVRKVGASVEEQIAALLHDISHTALSHVVDWALSTHPGGESFHEVHKQRYIDTMTQLPQLLREYNFQDPKVLDESQYPLVEMSAPRLCADRLDYALRDAVAFGKLELPVVRRIYSSLRAFPDATSRDRVLVLEDDSLAVQLSRTYLACDRDVWSNRAHVDMYRRTGQVIGDMIRQEKIAEKDLWTFSDEQFWELLRNAADPEQLKTIKRLESEGNPQEDGLRLPSEAKIRTLDPDVYLEGSQQPLPLSVVRPEWAHERQQYIINREKERA